MLLHWIFLFLFNLYHIRSSFLLLCRSIVLLKCSRSLLTSSSKSRIGQRHVDEIGARTRIHLPAIPVSSKYCILAAVKFSIVDLRFGFFGTGHHQATVDGTFHFFFINSRSIFPHCCWTMQNRSRTGYRQGGACGC